MNIRLTRDPALWFFGIGVLACLVVSLPATTTAMMLLHGGTWGIIAMIVFEFGAVGAEIASLWIPQWRGRLMAATITLLLATTAMNYALGVDHVAGAVLENGTYASLRTGGYGWLMALVGAAVFPAFLFGFLTAFTARVRMLLGKYDTPMAAIGLWLALLWADREQAVNEREQRLNTAEQDKNSLAQRLNTAEQRLNTAEQQREQAARMAEHWRAQVEHWQREAEEAMHRVPAPIEVEVIQVARYRLTYEQLAQMAGVSVSTVRRRLPELAGEVIEA